MTSYFHMVCSVSSADFAKVCGKSFFHKVKFNRLMFIKRDSLLMFMHKIFNQMVCINVKHPKVSLWRVEENEISSQCPEKANIQVSLFLYLFTRPVI